MNIPDWLFWALVIGVPAVAFLFGGLMGILLVIASRPAQQPQQQVTRKEPRRPAGSPVIGWHD